MNNEEKQVLAMVEEIKRLAKRLNEEIEANHRLRELIRNCFYDCFPDEGQMSKPAEAELLPRVLC